MPWAASELPHDKVQAGMNCLLTKYFKVHVDAPVVVSVAVVAAEYHVHVAAGGHHGARVPLATERYDAHSRLVHTCRYI